jgi:hypothetical protein
MPRWGVWLIGKLESGGEAAEWVWRNDELKGTKSHEVIRHSYYD